MSTYGLWLSATGMKVQEHRQTLLAHNMANAQTAGFKEDLAVFRARRVESRENAELSRFAHPILDDLAGGVNVKTPFFNFAQGSLEMTGRPLDVAIDGDGLFVVSDGSTTRYTRNGEFTINAGGDLVLSAAGGHWRVLDENARPIRVDPEGGDVGIASDGKVRQGGEVLSTIGMVTAPNKRSLHKFGETLFDADPAQVSRIPARLRSGTVEQSNFDVMRGLADMIEMTRAYEMNANLLTLQDQATGEAVNTVGRLT